MKQHDIIMFAVKYLSLIVPLLLAVAFLTLVERKVLASQQLRVGPNTVGYVGLLQPFADAAKLLMKESVIPSTSNRYLFMVGPLVTLILSIIIWAVIPTFPDSTLSDINLGISYIFAMSSLRRLWYINFRMGFKF